VTQIEAWMRNPYSIYARHILRLRPVKPLDEDPSAADYGQFIHRALDTFLKTVPTGPLPEDAFPRLVEIGRAELAQQEDRPSIRAFWWPRYLRIAHWFIATETERRRDAETLACEVDGELVLKAAAGPFVLSARADRIDRLRDDGGLVVIDYKTGTPPPEREIKAGFAPQLPLEAEMVRVGGFPGVPAARVAALEFWHLHGKIDGGERCRRIKDADVPEVCEDALGGVRNLVADFDLGETPYLARPRDSVAPKYDDYEHLARVREWSAGAETGTS
jgi:ATP-dependent helicase/nuclease subunit B